MTYYIIERNIHSTKERKITKNTRISLQTCRPYSNKKVKIPHQKHFWKKRRLHKNHNQPIPWHRNQTHPCYHIRSILNKPMSVVTDTYVQGVIESDTNKHFQYHIERTLFPVTHPIMSPEMSHTRPWSSPFLLGVPLVKTPRINNTTTYTSQPFRHYRRSRSTTSGVRGPTIHTRDRYHHHQGSIH